MAANRLIYLTVWMAMLAGFIGYLLYAPHSEGIPQINRVRAITASMKLAHLIGMVVEFFGVSNRVLVARQVASLTTLLKNKKTEDANLHIENTKIENVPVRIARPVNDQEGLPAIIYFHGGAFYMGSVDTHNALTSTLARAANVVVISVDYRLAPEHPFPAGLEDCYTVVKYILENKASKQLRLDPKRIALAGDSAGGSLAAVLAMRFATNPIGPYSPRLQILIYPSLQFFDLMLPSYVEQHFTFIRYTAYHKLSLYLNETIDRSIYANHHTTVAQKKFYRKYVDWSLIPAEYRNVDQKPIDDEHEGDLNLIEKAKKALDPEVSPLLVDDERLSKLPPTYILTVGHDRLRDEGLIYYGRLKRLGVSVVHHHYKNTFHGSITLLYGILGMDIAREMVDHIVEYIKTNL